MRGMFLALGLLALFLCSSAAAMPVTADASILFLIEHIEGIQLVPDDAGRGPSMFGINQAANPDVDVPHLTRARAIAIYKARYWRPIGADALPARLRFLVFDTCVNLGVAKTRAILALAREPSDLLRMRVAWHHWLSTHLDRLAPFAKSWAHRDALVARVAGLDSTSTVQLADYRH
jgi:Glycosyl hydrolase 108